MGTTIRAIGAAVEQPSEWVLAHQALSRLAKERAAADAEEGRCLLRALRSAAHLHLGFGSFAEYIERSFGYQPRSTQEKLRVAEALEQLPLLRRALEDGALHWSAIRELTRVAVPETEQEWLAVAEGKNVRQLEQLIAGKRPGDAPDSAHPPAARRHILRFEVTPETFATFREALTALRRLTGAPLDDDSALLAMARHLLGGPDDEGRSSYQIALNVCTECGRGRELAGGESVPVGADIVAMAQCDGQHLGHIPPPANQNAGAQADTQNNPVNRRPHAHVGARAKQTIPPALRRAVLLRDQRRCRVPGCKNAHYLDLHHITLRSDGGQNEPDNLLTLCGVHHRAAHRGTLAIEGTATDPRFHHADGSAYGRVLAPQVLDVYAKTFGALRHLGFKEAQIRYVLAQLRDEANSRVPTAQELLRAAVGRLTRTPSRH